MGLHVTTDSATTPPSQRIPTPSGRARLLWGVQCAVILGVIWLALTGVDALILGAITVIVGGTAGAWAVPGMPYPWRPLRLFRFAGFFLWSSISGGFDVAWRALHPRLAIDPRWMRYRLELPAGQPRTLMVSIMSLLPGTLSADLESDNVLLVHALMGSDPDAVRANVAQLEREIAWFFSLPEPSGEGR
ncbi:MAG: cation transporter [Gammaproteobacteria bacterium]|nr:MAG: cation transporter [Gammaproteobacteria bacterium]